VFTFVIVLVPGGGGRRAEEHERDAFKTCPIAAEALGDDVACDAASLPASAVFAGAISLNGDDWTPAVAGGPVTMESPLEPKALPDPIDSISLRP